MSTIQELSNRVRARRRVLDQMSGQVKTVVGQAKELKADVIKYTEDMGIFEQVVVLLNSIGEDRQLKAQQEIEELVTRGLQSIFDASLSFHILQTIKGKTANVEFIVRTTLEDSVVETPVLEARGGGLAATIGFLLRVVVLILKGGSGRESILILDETFAMVSDEYLPALGEFLRELVDHTGIQVIMVTHQSFFTEVADKVYRLSLKDGKTQVREDG